MADCAAVLAADGDEVYWIAVSELGEQWSVNKASPDGSHAVRLGKATPAEMMAVHKGAVTWARSTGENTSSVYQMSTAGGEATEVWSGIGRLSDLAVGDGGVVVRTYDGATKQSQITRIGFGEESSTVLATEPGYMVMTTDETSVYYLKQFEGTLSKVSLHDGTAVVLASELELTFEVVVDLAAVYVLQPDKVLRVWLSGGAPELVAEIGGSDALMHRDGIFFSKYTACSTRCTGELVKLVK